MIKTSGLYTRINLPEDLCTLFISVLDIYIDFFLTFVLQLNNYRYAYYLHRFRASFSFL